jgi:hypothetical protein
MKFGVYGAYELPRINGKVIDDTAKSKRTFWDAIDEEIEGLSGACGCYIFAAHNKPWYVGRACKQSFRKECLAHHKVSAYNHVLGRYERAAPWLYLLPKLTPAENFANPSVNGHRDISALEKILIGFALARNEDAVNISGTKFLREMNVPGIINSKPGQSSSTAVKGIRSLFGF